MEDSTKLALHEAAEVLRGLAAYLARVEFMNDEVSNPTAIDIAIELDRLAARASHVSAGGREESRPHLQLVAS